MITRHILATVNLAHYYNSAFDRNQLYRFLQIKVPRNEFEICLDDMIRKELIWEENGRIFCDDVSEADVQRRIWSLNVFRKYRRYQLLIARLPWVQYVGLTGANAFESCKENDDLDMFIITTKKRLWLTYLVIVIFSKLLRKREILCVNYLVDEDHMLLHKQTYYTAVQLVQMVSVFNPDMKKKLLKENDWICQYLPNLKSDTNDTLQYIVYDFKKRRNGNMREWLNHLNLLIFNKYYRRLENNYRDFFGQSMIVNEGVAKLHRNDHHDTYADVLLNMSGSKLKQLYTE